MRSWVLCLGMVCASGGQLQSARADYFLPHDLTFLSVHPDAQAQATQSGRTLRHITAFADRLYFGYGDWIADTGPIAIRNFDPVTASWSPPLLNYGTEAISHYRELDGQLYTTNVDPLLGPGVNPGGFAVGNSSHQWSSMDAVAATHVFDINQTSNGDLWMVGSNGNAGMVWQSTDGGQSFTIQRADALGTQPWEFSRYTGVGVLNDHVYVQRVDPNFPATTASLFFDGSTWQSGPNLLPDSLGYITQPEEFLNHLVYLDAELEAGYLYKFNGSEAERAFNYLVHDFKVYEGSLVILAEGGEVLRSTDLDTWLSLGVSRDDARSFSVWDGDLYFGTTDSSVWYVENGFISVVPEPQMLGVWSVLIACGLLRRTRERGC